MSIKQDAHCPSSLCLFGGGGEELLKFFQGSQSYSVPEQLLSQSGLADC